MNDNTLCSALVADPPWEFDMKKTGGGFDSGASSKYSTLSLDQIKAFPLPTFEKNAILFLWRVSSMVEEAYAVCRAWGFVPKTEIVWFKGSKKDLVIDPNVELTDEEIKLHMGMGTLTRGAHETCIVATRGTFKVQNRGVRSVFFAPAQEHSRKPDVFYDLVEKLVWGGSLERADEESLSVQRRLREQRTIVELFARRERPAWDCYGNELARPSPLWMVASVPSSSENVMVVGGTNSARIRLVDAIDQEWIWATARARAEVDQAPDHSALIALLAGAPKRGRKKKGSSHDPSASGREAHSLPTAGETPENQQDHEKSSEGASGETNTSPPHENVTERGRTDREHKIARAKAEGLLSLDLYGEDAWIRLQFEAPPGWFSFTLPPDSPADTANAIAKRGIKVSLVDDVTKWTSHERVAALLWATGKIRTLPPCVGAIIGDQVAAEPVATATADPPSINPDAVVTTVDRVVVGNGSTAEEHRAQRRKREEGKSKRKKKSNAWDVATERAKIEDSP